MQLSQQIAGKIQRRLDRGRIPRKEFAAMMGVTPPVVTLWLKGEHNFTIATLEKIQQALKITFFDFAEEESSRHCFPCEVDGLNINNHAT